MDSQTHYNLIITSSALPSVYISVFSSLKNSKYYYMGNCQPFAIMRLTHESIRSGLNEIQGMIDQKEKLNVEELKSLYEDVKRIIQLHAKQEEDVFYVELNKKANGVAAPFSTEHEEEKLAFEKIDGLMNDADSTENKALLFEELNKWVDNHHKHLVHEEKELMELLPKVFTYGESVEVVRSIIGHDLNEFENFHMKWVYDRLNAGQKDMYMGMLKGCSPGNKFGDFEKRILA